MQAFLAALTPTLRANVQIVVDAFGEDAIRAVVARYITDDGDWPTEPETASFLASQFLDNYGVIADELEHYPPVFSGSGLKQATVAGLAGGALSVGSAKGATVLSSRLMGMYWKEMLGYAMGTNPAMLTAVHRVFGMMTKNTRWAQLAKDLSRPSSPFSDFGKTYQQLLERELLGILGRSAWRGARSAVTHYAGQIGPPSQASPWVQNYVHTFAQNQRTITERTMMQIINQGLERGLSERVLATDLRDYWTLTPKHAQAVENYRKGLAQQDRTVTSTRRLTRAYADRLTRSRVEAMSKTEVLTTFNLGREIQWKQAVQSGELPANTVKMWVTAQDELVCKVCRPLDGMTAALGSPFETDRATLYAPTAHPNCRCLLIPVEDQTFPDISQNKQFVFARDLVNKHLGGPSGEDDHPSGTPQSVHAIGRKMYELGQVLNSMGEDTFFSRKKMGDVLGSESAADELFDEIVAFTSNMNSVRELRSSSKRLRDLVRAAPRVDKQLYRGEALYTSPEAAEEALKKGTIIRRELTSFTDNKDIARIFDGKRLGREDQSVSVRMSLVPGARGVHIEPVTNSNGRRARGLGEYLISGDFEVMSARRDGNTMDIEIRPLDEISKRTITIGEYLRGDGTRVEEHERKIGMKSVEEFLSNFERDGELSTHEAFTLGTIATLGLAIASRGRIRRRLTPSVYKDIRKTKDGFVPSEALRKNLMETFEFKGSQYSTRVNTIKVGDQPHHVMSAEALRETLGESNRIAQGFSRTFARRNNIRVEGNVLNRDGLIVGEFDIAIDPRRREAFQYGFFLNKGVQGKGFSGEFTTHLGKRYMETGIERVGALASGSVGGYAWAQRGFNWRYGPSYFVHEAVENAARGRHPNLGTQPAEVMREIRSMERRLLQGHLTRRFPTPQEVANIGRNRPFAHPLTGEQTWAGKEIMMGTQWHASMDLRQMQRLLRQEGVIKSYPLVAWTDLGVSGTSEPIPGIKATV